MSAIVVNEKHHEYAQKMEPGYMAQTAQLRQPLGDVFLVMDRVFFMISSGLDDPKLTKNEKEWDVFHFLFTRGMKTLRSIRYLLEMGCEQDALALLRNLTETTLTGKYIAAKDTNQRAERFRDFTVVEKYRNMVGYRDAGLQDFKKQFPDNTVTQLEAAMTEYMEKYKISKYKPGLTWINISLYDIAGSDGVDMLHDYIQVFSTYSMLTHASYQGRDAYKNVQGSRSAINWAPTVRKAPMVGFMASWYTLILAQTCIRVMGIGDLDDLIFEIQCNLASRLNDAGYKTGDFSVKVPAGSWGVLKRDSETGEIIF